MKFSEISKLINRDERTIWINYNNSLKKQKTKFKIKKQNLIPITILSNRKLSILESLIRYLKQNNLRNYEIAKLLNKDERIISTLIFRIKKKIKKQIKEKEAPLAIFSQKLSPAESLCKYLKENLNMKFSEISKLINRDERTIWINYNNSLKKQKTKFKIKKQNLIPITILSNRKLSILESLIRYLKQNNLRNYEIAKLLDKNQRNIWTIYNRTKQKLHHQSYK